MQNNKIIIWIIVIMALSSFVSAIQYNITQDAEVTLGTPNNNYGGLKTEQYLQAGADVYRFYFMVNLTGIVNSANYSFYVSDVGLGTQNIEFYYCNDTFDERTITWNNQGTEVINCNATPFYSKDRSTFTGTAYNIIPITTAIQSAINPFTIKVKLSNEGGSGFLGFLPSNSTNPNYVTYATTTNLPQDNINVSTTLPNTNSNFTTNTINFNATVNSTYNFNISLYINSTLNETKTYSSGTNVFINFTKSLTDGTYSYYMFGVQSNDTSQNETTTTKTLYVDTQTPIIVSTVFNGNNTYQTQNLNLTASFTDNLYLKNMTITQTCGGNYQNLSIGTTTYTYTNSTINISGCNLGTQYSNITVCDLLQCTTKNYQWENRAGLNITAYSSLTNLSIQNFNVYVNNVLSGSTTTYSYLLTNLTNTTNYNITLVSLGYATTDNIKYINSTINYLNVSMYTTNSISINIYDESNGSTIGETISIKFTTNTTEFTNTTTTSTFYIDNLVPDTYNIQFSGSTYSPRTYTLTVGNNSHQFLNAYLTKSITSTIFNIMSNTNVPLENVSFTVYKIVNSTWVSIESKFSDITGKVQFIYTPYTNYKFFLTKSGYNDIIFYLNPVLLSSYDIKMIPLVTQTIFPDYTGVSIIYAPTLFYPGTNTLTFIISSPDGLLTQYGYNISYPSDSNTTTGTNSIGGTLTTTFNIVNPSFNDRVKLDYYYITSDYGRRNFTMYYSINVNATYINNTFIGNQNKTYGLGLIERLLIATVLIILIVGIFSLVGKQIPGLVFGMFVYGWMVYIGFIPLWSILLSITLGLLILGLRGNS